MGKGRKPTPAHLRVVKGVSKANAGRENPNLPEPVGELGNPPASMGEQAAAVWKETAPYWGDQSDRQQFEAYCIAVADAARFYLKAEGVGWWYESVNGNLVRHPAAILYENNRAFANKLASEFGLNPTSKNKIKAPPKRKPSPGDEFNNKGR